MCGCMGSRVGVYPVHVRLCEWCVYGCPREGVHVVVMCVRVGEPV